MDIWTSSCCFPRSWHRNYLAISILNCPSEFSSNRSSDNHHFDYFATIRVVCAFPCHCRVMALGLLLSKDDRGIFNMRNDLHWRVSYSATVMCRLCVSMPLASGILSSKGGRGIFNVRNDLHWWVCTSVTRKSRKTVLPLSLSRLGVESFPLDWQPSALTNQPTSQEFS